MEKFLNDCGSSDLQSYINVLNAYLENAFSVEIENVGFNKNSGYVYIALVNGVQIASCFGQSVDYIIIDERGEEIIFEDYNDARNNI